MMYCRLVQQWNVNVLQILSFNTVIATSNISEIYEGSGYEEASKMIFEIWKWYFQFARRSKI